MESEYRALVQAIGLDPDVHSHEDVLRMAATLNKIKTGLQHESPEKTGRYFVCGEAGDKDDVGLPDYILVCPTYGLAGFATYRKDRDYSEPGY